MPYILSFKNVDTFEKSFDTVEDALVNYGQIQNKVGWVQGLSSAKLSDVEKKTFVNLYPGIVVKEATDELESAWEWDPADSLKIRPVLKMRYRTTA
ncbi:hypothetical protein AM274_28885 [Pseudomonas nunensis]|nr:hypothetical protein AM274_28885 [Pseudomonas nunensis]